jgi:hypothetical protein
MELSVQPLFEPFQILRRKFHRDFNLGIELETLSNYYMEDFKDSELRLAGIIRYIWYKWFLPHFITSLSFLRSEPSLLITDVYAQCSPVHVMLKPNSELGTIIMRESESRLEKCDRSQVKSEIANG